MTARLTHIGGEGRPVVLIHGFGADRLSFLSLVSSLPEPASFHAVELPGHGLAGRLEDDASPAGLADDVARALATLPWPLPVVGHSLGGAVALELARRHPDVVASLVLISPAGLGEALDADFLHEFPEVTDGSAAQTLLERLVVRPRHIPKGLGDQVVASLSDTRRRELRRIAAALLEAPEPVVPDVPVTLIWGADDVINPLDPGRSYPANVSEHVVAGAGHMPHVERAGQTARMVAQALG